MGGAGGSGTQNFVYQKWPDQIFSIVNFVLSHDGHFGLKGGGGGSRGEYPPPPPMVYGHSNTSRPDGCRLLHNGTASGTALPMGQLGPNGSECASGCLNTGFGASPTPPRPCHASTQFEVFLGLRGEVVLFF